MTIKVGSAKLDENGKITGGAVGDQTGREVAEENFYMDKRGWHVLRPISPEIADKIAAAMRAACENDNIGYDQSNRLGVITMLRKYGTLAKIDEKTEADCSSLVRACCIQAGFDPGNFTTAGEATALENTGMFEKRKAVTSTTALYDGDILVTKTKGHTVVVTSGNPRKREENKPEQKPETGGGFEMKQYRVPTGRNMYKCSNMKNKTGAVSAGTVIRVYNIDGKVGFAEYDLTYGADYNAGSRKALGYVDLTGAVEV